MSSFHVPISISLINPWVAITTCTVIHTHTQSILAQYSKNINDNFFFQIFNQILWVFFWRTTLEKFLANSSGVLSLFILGYSLEGFPGFLSGFLFRSFSQNFIHFSGFAPIVPTLDVSSVPFDISWMVFGIFTSVPSTIATGFMGFQQEHLPEFLLEYSSVLFQIFLYDSSRWSF